MSSTTWTHARLSSEFRPYVRRVWRLVEAQYVVSTMKLVDTLAEQEIVEALIEATKPAVPPECEGRHYLLSTPFAMRLTQTALASAAPVLPLASTMRRKNSARPRPKPPSIGSCSSPNHPPPRGPRTPSNAQASRSRSRQHDRSTSPYHRSPTRASGATRSNTALARTSPPRRARPAPKSCATPPLATQGVCAAVLTCNAFRAPSPRDRETWRIGVGQSGAYALREFPEARLEFGRNAFAADPRIAAMQWER